MTTAELTDHEIALPAPPLELRDIMRKLGAGALVALPGGLTLYLSFNAGGFYPGVQGVVVAVLAGVLILRMALVRDPFAGLSRPLKVAVGALALYSLWSLLSSHWSHAPDRSMLGFELANLYLLTVLLFGSAARSQRRVRWTMGLTWASMLFVCLTSLATRLRPDLFPIPGNLSPDRLAFPLTYWNALGLFAATGITIGLYFASSTREPRAVRVIATSSLPIFGVTILLTYSRSAIILGAAGLIAFALLARPRGLPGALISAGPTTAFVIAQTYQAKLISNAGTSAAAVQEGRQLTVSILVACFASALARVALLELDSRLANMPMSSARRNNARILLALICGVAVFASLAAFGGQIASQWNNFTRQDSTLGDQDVRNRISDIRIGTRLPGWRIAIQSFDRSPVHGTGADTFPIEYYKYRPGGGVALEAHSLYLEAMSELGIVGLVAILSAIVLLIGGCIVRSRRSSRSMWLALAVIGLVWAVHAGVDWDWQMPAATLPVFALTATSLARRGGRTRLRARWEIGLRVIVALLALVVLVTAVETSLSDTYLDRAVAAFNTGNCRTAVVNAHETVSALSSRPQPYQIMGLCDVVTGHPRPAVGLMEEAAARDPQDWVYRYSLAIATAAVGRDPRPALKQAELLDPLESMIRDAAVSFSGSNPRRWERAAPHAEMLVSSTD